MTGYPDGTFRPDNSITRAEFAAALARAMGWQENPGAANFADGLPEWARGFIGAMVERGVTQGYEDNTFRPDQPISRAEMVVMIMRALGIEPAGTPGFSDNIPDWAKGYVAAAAGQGIVNGKPGNLFAPADDSTRAETAVMILRMLGE